MITNVYGWPEAIRRAVENDSYDRGDADLSVTDLCKPVQLFALQRQAEAAGSVQVDVADRVWALWGQALHVVLERAGGSTGLKEKRLFAQVGEHVVSGQVDRYDADANVYFRTTLEDGPLIVQDYKGTSVGSWIYGGAGVRGEWQDQLNFLAHLLRENGYRVDRLEVVAIYRDWSPTRKLPYGAPKGATYPDSEVSVIPVEMYPVELTAAVMAKRVKDRMAALELSPQELAQRYPCNDDERWSRNPKKPWYTRCWGGKAHGNRRRPYCPVAGICAQNQGAS